MFIVGDNYYGKVDRLPGYFYVTTRFLHVWWIPLIPQESYVMLDNVKERQGIRIPLCRRSVIKGYVFAYTTAWSIMCFSTLIFLYFAKNGFRNLHESNPTPGLAIMGVIAGCLALWFARRPLPKVDRARELGGMLGIQTDVIVAELNRAQLEDKGD